MDWKILGKVLFQVFGFITVCLIAIASVFFSVAWLGMWSLMIIPTFLLCYVTAMMYRDEMVRQGKRQH
jgi:NADH:ubiquinone oxidoreductase subunit 3 (subunit A)